MPPIDNLCFSRPSHCLCVDRFTVVRLTDCRVVAMVCGYRGEAVPLRHLPPQLCLQWSSKGSPPHSLRRQGFQLCRLRPQLHHQRIVETTHVHPQRDEAVHVSVLSENVQDIGELQEAHEDAQVGLLHITVRWSVLTLSSIVLLVAGWRTRCV